MPTRNLVTSHEQDLALFPDVWHRVALVLAAILIVAVPTTFDARWLGITNLALVTMVGSVALMILTGFAGQISLGHAAFLALGAYTTAVLGEQVGLPFWLAMPVSGGVAAVVGLAVGPFALRMKGLYLAIVTLGLLFLVDHVLLSLPQWTHGVSGIAVPMHGWFPGPDDSVLGTFTEPMEFGPVTLAFEHKLYWVFLPVSLATVWMGKNLQRSNTGRAMVAVRDRDMAAATLGVAPARIKIVAFGLSSFFAGVAGSMFALQQQYITVAPPFDLAMSVQYIAMIVIGGVGSTFGAVAGALVYVGLEPLMDSLGGVLPLLSQLGSAQRSTLLFSVLVAAFLVFEPLGLLGIWLRIKRYFLAWPFRY